uniref:BPTI/Kunitz inhibitor domain-containing protein n=1 Tax=Sinocyclocheilus rhinocerous TaxID=307959 RepID=A0A673NDX8_9TELE
PFPWLLLLFLHNILTPDPGECFGHYLRYYYSPEHHTCKSFYWTGCVGNGNRFLTLNWCNATCYNKRGKKDGKSAEQPLKEQSIEMGGGEAQPATLEVSTIS